MTKPPLFGPGDIFLTRFTGDVALLIRTGQFLNGDGWADWEHAGVIVDDLGTTVEAEPGGAKNGNIHSYSNIRILSCPDPYRDGVAQAAVGFGPRDGHMGVGYSALDYEALALHRFRIPAPGLREYIDSTGHMICSQLADRSAMLGAWHLFDDNRWPGYVTPGALNKLWRHLNTFGGPAWTL